MLPTTSHHHVTLPRHHHHVITTTSHYHVITTTSSPPCHHHIITTTSSPPRHHHHVITTTSSPPRHHHHVITTTSSPPLLPRFHPILSFPPSFPPSFLPSFLRLHFFLQPPSFNFLSSTSVPSTSFPQLPFLQLSSFNSLPSFNFLQGGRGNGILDVFHEPYRERIRRVTPLEHVIYSLFKYFIFKKNLILLNLLIFISTSILLISVIVSIFISFHFLVLIFHSNFINCV